MQILGKKRSSSFIREYTSPHPAIPILRNLDNFCPGAFYLALTTVRYKQYPIYCIFLPSKNNGLEKCMFLNVKKVLKFQNKKNDYNAALCTLY